ncbi:DUF1648 domain-containing protein [Conexibacter arvalis]|uniref:DUF1648 domain-containing protein n=1 Tax=Conexibacter arvalis TaxID=912552 RepID=A0A840IE49_9ACTN|nr:DUF1648 domain-containing protein [Conexibacter arvalis]MBB4663062.1 hypothetical protein [Conexibacter arvalis]
MLRRAILLAGGPLAALLAFAAAALLAGDLPDPIATHWGVGGEPDGRMPLWIFVAAVAVAELVAWGGLVWQARARGAAGLRLTVAPYAWATLAFLTALGLITLAANDGAADWRAADEVGLPSVALALAAGALAGLAAWALERGRPLGEPGRGDGVGSSSGDDVALAPGERVVWSRALVSRPAVVGAVVLGGGLLVAAVVVGGPGGWGLALGGVVAAIAAGALTEIVVTVDRRGLAIAYGPFGWPRQTVPLAEIAGAEPTMIDPWRVGGWGYRKARPGMTAVVLRGGEGLRIVRVDGRELLVTIPDAAAGAALLNALRTRG